MSLEQLSDRYAEHNRVERGAGFVFAGPQRVELFRRYVGGPGRHVLDLGCRDGALTQAYAGENEIVGVDADREALAEAEKLGIETRWADLDDALPFADGTFDVVVAGELLEHLRGAPRPAAGRHVRRLRSERLPSEEQAPLRGWPEARGGPDPSADVLAERHSCPTRRIRGRATA